MTSGPAEAARVAVEADVEAVAGLCRAAALEVAGERGGALLVASGCLPEPLEETVRARLASGRDLVGVGTIDRTVVGAVVAGRRELDGQVLAAVNVLYVEPAARSVGVGEALIDLVLGWAADTGCTGVDAPALPGMRTTKNFFERAGFVTRLLVMHRRVLVPGPEPAVGRPG